MRTLSHWALTVFASPVGVFVLGALDSTLFFSLPLGIDAVVIILAAQFGPLFWVVALLACAGSLVGAALTFWMGAKIGEKGLDRYVPARRLERIQRRIQNSGAVTLAALDLIPPPFPFTPFVLAAGALRVRARVFFVTLLVCRLLRFGVEASLARIYGRSIVGWLESDIFHTVVTVMIGMAVILTALSIVKLIRLSRTSGRRAGLRAPA